MLSPTAAQYSTARLNSGKPTSSDSYGQPFLQKMLSWFLTARLFGSMVILGFVAFTCMKSLNLMVATLVEKKLAGTAVLLSLFAVPIWLIVQQLLISAILDVKASSTVYYLIFGTFAASAYVGCFIIRRINIPKRSEQNKYKSKKAKSRASARP